METQQFEEEIKETEEVSKVKKTQLVVLILLVLTALTVTSVFAINVFFRKELENAIYFTVVEQNKKRLKDLVDTTIISFVSKESSLKQDLKKRLRREVLNAYKIAWDIYRECKKYKCDDRKTKKLIVQALRDYRFLTIEGISLLIR
ncbi:Cache domain-containing protein [Desulfurobacterium pacificum]|uniref:Cache domain-containing protein n=1 Tax=Desulfurobacterium pacificum TaxID=240166 RepID=A0ABY1NVP6_9BACT|nr:Cache domain-containing protein [Desulfurobacterium pacificum]